MSILLKVDRFGHKMIRVGNHQADVYALLANFSSISNLILGVYILAAILFKDPDYDIFLLARLMVLGASFDAVDGKLARRSNTKPRLGAQFDTAADLVTFALAPAAMILFMFYSVNPIVALIFAGIYLFCASFRLSRFMMEPTTVKVKYFRGMPSPPAAVFIAGWFVQSEPNLVWASISIMFISALMVTSFPFTAMKVVKTLFQKINFIFTVSIMILFTYAPNSWMEFIGKLWIFDVTYFGILGPYHAYKTLKVNDII